jgi:hypothetical protein
MNTGRDLGRLRSSLAEARRLAAGRSEQLDCRHVAVALLHDEAVCSVVEDLQVDIRRLSGALLEAPVPLGLSGSSSDALDDALEVAIELTVDRRVITPDCLFRALLVTQSTLRAGCEKAGLDWRLVAAALGVVYGSNEPPRRDVLDTSLERLQLTRSSLLSALLLATAVIVFNGASWWVVPLVALVAINEVIIVKAACALVLVVAVSPVLGVIAGLFSVIDIVFLRRRYRLEQFLRYGLRPPSKGARTLVRFHAATTLDQLLRRAGRGAT